jgi:hypothetical protein
VRRWLLSRAALTCLAACAFAGCGTTKIVTVSQQTSSTAGSPASPRAAHDELTVDGTATLAGERSDERLQATLLAYKPSLTVGEYDTPGSGMKFVGVILKIKNVGSTPYSDSPSNGATILTATGHQGKTAIIASGECSEGFASGVKIAPGESQEGCIPFELPDEDAAAKFQWTPASGFAEETGEWTIPSAGSTPATSPGKNETQPAASGRETGTPIDAVDAYWYDINEHDFSGAYQYLAPGSLNLTEAQFVSSEEQSHIQSAQFRGQVASEANGGATVEVLSLTTHDAQYGCRTWSGSYDMTGDSAGWLIERANLSPQACSN